MSQVLAAGGATSATLGAIQAQARRTQAPEEHGKWWRFALITVITFVVIIPILAVLLLSLQPGLGSSATGFTLENFVDIFQQTDVLIWLGNSLVVTLITVIVAVVIAAPAGYVLSRVRNRLVSSYSLVLFVVQSLPVVTAVIPLFITFAALHLVNTLPGVAIIYIGSTPRCRSRSG